MKRLVEWGLVVAGILMLIAFGLWYVLRGVYHVPKFFVSYVLEKWKNRGGY